MRPPVKEKHIPARDIITNYVCNEFSRRSYTSINRLYYNIFSHEHNTLEALFFPRAVSYKQKSQRNCTQKKQYIGRKTQLYSLRWNFSDDFYVLHYL